MEPTAQSLARTYSDRVYDDPWEKVLDYRRVKAYEAEHPNTGSSAAATALELPRSRIRPWMNGAKPDSVHGIQTAIDHGWLNPDPYSVISHRLVELLAHVLAGGRIAKRTIHPAASPGRRVSVVELQEAFERVGLGTNVQHEDVKGKAAEVVPTADGAVLGRCLVTMKAPQGDKTEMVSLPPVLEEMPPDTRQSFVEIYARHRAIEYEQKATLRIQEARPASYFDALEALFADVTGESVTADENGITISADAARELDLDD